MKKNFKLALVPLAIAGAMTANSAFAGSEACWEVYDGDPTDVDTTYAMANGQTVNTVANTRWNGVLTADVVYTLGTCTYAGTGPSNDLYTNDPVSIATELTRSVTLDLSNVTDASPATASTNVVYIPTTTLPSGTRIEVVLSNVGATFQSDTSQIHMLQLDTTGDLTVAKASGFIAAATTDGAVNGQSLVTFVVPAGTVVAAGSRLALSISPTEVVPPEIQFAENACVAATDDIWIRSQNTVNGTSPIAGGDSDNTPVIDPTTQFTFDVGTAAAGVVDALEPSVRTSFLVDTQNGSTYGSLVGALTAVQLPVTFTDNGANLDRAVALTANDELMFKAHSNGAALSSNVVLSLFDDASENGTAADTFANIIDFDNLNASIGIDQDSGTATTHTLEATETWTNATTATTNDGYFLLWNDDQNDPISPSVFNVSFQSYLDFEATSLRDHCEQTDAAYNITTNGSVLKVPYAFNTYQNFIRVTNESADAAVISMDIMDEMGNSKAVGVELDQMAPGMGSVVLRTDNLIQQAADKAGFVVDSTNRVTITLTVSAPNNSVHGVSVQTIPGGVDRVMPVLDLNDWQQ